MFVAFINLNLVICTRQVNSAEHLHSTKLVRQVLDIRDWENVKVSLLIQNFKIYTYSELSCFFTHNQDRGTIEQNAGANPALCQYVIYILQNHLKFIDSKMVLLVARGGWNLCLPNQWHGQALCGEPNPESGMKAYVQASGT